MSKIPIELAQEVIYSLPTIVRDERVRRGLSARAVARRVGISHTALSEYERYHGHMSWATLDKLLAWLVATK